MTSYRVVALRQELADEVRESRLSPNYGHPAHVEVAKGYGPCRLCLGQFRTGEEERVLFTHNPFPTGADLPSPGPVFVHKDACARHEGAGLPPGLVGLPLTLEGYDSRGLVRARVRIAGDPAAAIATVLSDAAVAYAHLRNTEAGCFIAKVERGEGADAA
jgi:hypothetical protein